MKPKTKKRLKITSISIVVFLLIVAGAFYIYTLDYYRADEAATEAIASASVDIESMKDMMVFYPPQVEDQEQVSDTGIIFYPGGKVEAAAYAPLLRQLSEKGITTVLMEMPFNLAVFDMNAADRVFNQLPEVKHWVIGGHSLGGAMASSYASKHSDTMSGLVLLGAYPTGDMDLPTLAIYGSEDVILNTSKLEGTENKQVIVGGNHAYFGNYGEQKGDGIAQITREEQQQQTVNHIVDFIFNLK